MKTIKKRLDTLQNGEVVEISIGESNLVHERRLAIIGLANADNVVVQQNGLA
jgi:TusA-related sulfurtransferase